MPPFQPRSVTVTPPEVERLPFHSCEMDWPAGKVHPTRQPVMGDEPVFRTVTSAWKPPAHLLISRYDAAQPAPTVGVTVGVTDTVGVTVGETVGDGAAMARS
jgi:hypothetical protein